MLTLWDTLLGRSVTLTIKEDNEATIEILRKGYSAKLRHVPRHHRIDLGSVFEQIKDPCIQLEAVKTDAQCADIFTKGLGPQKWEPAIDLLGINTKMPN